MTNDEKEVYWSNVRVAGKDYIGNRRKERAERQQRGELPEGSVSVWGENPKSPSESANHALAVLHSGDVKTVLEIGCGEGRDAVRFAMEGFEVTACDYSPEGIAMGRSIAARHKVDVDFHETDYLDDPPIAGSYDAVVALKFLHQVRRQEAPAFLARVRANTVPGGLLILSTFAAEEDDNFVLGKEMGRSIEEEVYEVRPKRPITFWREQPLRGILETCEFRTVNMSLLRYHEENHVEFGQEEGGRHLHALWFVAAKRVD